MNETNNLTPDHLVPFDASSLKAGQFDYHYHYVDPREAVGKINATRIHWGYRSLQSPKNWWSGITSTVEQAAEEAERLSGERIPRMTSRYQKKNKHG